MAVAVVERFKQGEMYGPSAGTKKVAVGGVSSFDCKIPGLVANKNFECSEIACPVLGARGGGGGIRC